MGLSLECKNLDNLLNKGLESGKITNFYGEAGSGKTNIALQSCVSCIKNGKRVLFINSGKRFSTERFEQIFNEEALKEIDLIEPGNFKDQFDIIKNLEVDNKIGLIVIDSIVFFYRLDFHKDVKKANHRLKHQLLKLKEIAENKKIPVLITTQVYEDVKNQKQEIVGKYISKKYSDYIIRLEKQKYSIRKATIIKPIEDSTIFEIMEKGIKS